MKVTADERDGTRGATLPRELMRLIETARMSAHRVGLDQSYANRILDNIVSVAERDQDYTSLEISIQQHIQHLDKWRTVLQDLLEQVEALERAQAQRERYSEQWWHRRRETLDRTFRADPQQGEDYWTKTYADALITWRLDICDKLLTEAFPPNFTELHTLFQEGTRSIKTEHYERALDMLVYLTEDEAATQTHPLLDATSKALLLIFIGRIYLYELRDIDAARERFDQAKTLIPRDGRPYAAIGEYYRAQREWLGALNLYQRAISLSPLEPDGYIGMSLISEDQERWDEADKWYEQAVDVIRANTEFGIDYSTLNKMLAPVSGNLYFHIAHRLKREDPKRALEAASRATDLGVKGAAGTFPERSVYELKGKLLESLHQRNEAAEAYYQAGIRYLWTDEEEAALPLLSQAADLRPNDALTYWSWADGLRMSSYLAEPPYVNEDSIKRSLEKWNIGARIRLPDTDESWAYVTRALISEQLVRLLNKKEVTLWWEAIVYLERSLLLYDADPLVWALLGRYYRYLALPSSALEGTSKAIDISSDYPTVLEERTAVLIYTGQFTAAEETIAKLKELQPSPWADTVLASTQLLSGHHQEVLQLNQNNAEVAPRIAYQRALESVEVALKAAPRDMWPHEIRADCHKRLGNQESAKEDYRWIWRRRDDPSYINDSFARIAFARAGYELGKDLEKEAHKLAEAIKIYGNLKEHPAHAGEAYRNLGICYLTRLAQGDLENGRQYLYTGIPLADTATELDALYLDIEDVEKSSNNSSADAQVHEVLEQAKETIEQRRVELDRRPSAEQELRQVVATWESSNEIENWPLIGARAGLARLLSEQKEWNEAARLYQLLSKEHDRFPEADTALESIAAKPQG